ncbi:putative Mitochondrial uncoupling protein 3 [Cardiosporidium cionae]|uniref:Mitochondrial uncoupling protein 3 n=1 Tax=Cardiosporidium cionae TaxID=476202 RepID=A0ABQ7JAM7_9APIC|nr:putative Mitochondrial uncoupling protein 3 [Cardiosporidium cionae]|eukprot:KAF8821041.1 putative Mitochondrial uncoupling protein 3 [Cardiosporidium cionae]
MDSNLGYFRSAGASCLACCCSEALTIPFDTLKVRLQVVQSREAAGVFRTFSSLLKEEGILAPWKGLSAGLQRQFVFGGLRISIYTPVRDFYSRILNYDKDAVAPLFLKILAGISSGAIAMTIANPTDVVKIRLQADSRRPGSAQPRYSGSLNAYSTIVRTQGLRGLWVGVAPNILRNSIINSSELAAYDQIKQVVLQYKLMQDGIGLHVVGGFLAGVVATIIGSPVDVLKTRLMNAPPGHYTSMVDAIVKTTKTVGLRGFYNGFGPNCLRMGTFNTLCFVFLEQFRHQFSRI